jgi:hypothetical protein
VIVRMVVVMPVTKRMPVMAMAMTVMMGMTGHANLLLSNG